MKFVTKSMLFLRLTFRTDLRKREEISLDKSERMCYNKRKKEVSPVEDQIRPVDVISVCSAAGEIRPLRLRMEDEAHGILCINIDEIISMKPICFVGIEAQIFLCRATVDGKKWLFELKYTIRTHTWCFFRRVL